MTPEGGTQSVSGHCRFGVRFFALMQRSKACALLPALDNAASRSHSYASGLELFVPVLLLSFSSDGRGLTHPARSIAAANIMIFIHRSPFMIEGLPRKAIAICHRQHRKSLLGFPFNGDRSGNLLPEFNTLDRLR